jgi:4-amino-4-deoxy-L-arabinose transferase-like glycosyltransferase
VPRRHLPWVAVAAFVFLGAWLRFTGLGWGVRHPMHTDERVYVDNVVAMLRAGDLDHRFYTYPGLFFYLLALPLRLLGPAYWDGATPFVVSRAVVSAFGVANIAIAFVVARRLAGTAAGLTAAALLAVSPLDIRTSHEVRPDVLLQGFGLLALLRFQRLRTWRDDAESGLLVGLATAIKFTGLLMVPMYVAHRLLLAPRRTFLGGVALASAVIVAVVLVATPYAIIHAGSYASGPGNQLKMYYGNAPTEHVHYFSNLGYYLRDGYETLGVAGTLLLAGGLVLALRREPATWGARLVHPVTVVLVMSTALLVFPRLILPAMGVVYVLIGVAVTWIAERSRAAAAAAALLAFVPATQTSYRFARYLAAPSARDKALDWIAANVPKDARILETRFDAGIGGRAGAILGLDRARYDVVERNEGDRAELRLLAPEMDLIITGPGPGGPGTWGESLVTVFRGLGAANDLVLQLKRPDPRFVPDYRWLAARDLRLRVSDHAEQAAALVDGDPITHWSTDGALRGGEWIEIEWAAPIPVGRIELRLGNAPQRHGPDLEVSVRRADGGTWGAAKAAPARPEIAEQLEAQARGSTRPLSLAFVLNPRPITALRLTQTGVRPEPWVVSELRVGARQ